MCGETTERELAAAQGMLNASSLVCVGLQRLRALEGAILRPLHVAVERHVPGEAGVVPAREAGRADVRSKMARQMERCRKTGNQLGGLPRVHQLHHAYAARATPMPQLISTKLTGAEQTTPTWSPFEADWTGADAGRYCDADVDYLKIDHCGGVSHALSNTSWEIFRAALTTCAEKRGEWPTVPPLHLWRPTAHPLQRHVCHALSTSGLLVVAVVFMTAAPRHAVLCFIMWRGRYAG